MVMSEEQYQWLLGVNERGYEAGYAGWPATSNPYLIGDDGHVEHISECEAWERGWEDGKAQREEEEAEGRNGNEAA